MVCTSLGNRRGRELLEIQERSIGVVGVGREGACGGESEGSGVGRGVWCCEGADDETEVGAEFVGEGIDGDEEEDWRGERGGGRCGRVGGLRGGGFSIYIYLIRRVYYYYYSK